MFPGVFARPGPKCSAGRNVSSPSAPVVDGADKPDYDAAASWSSAIKRSASAFARSADLASV